MLFTDDTARHCSRCYANLEDPASREHGQGPVCRNKDTHLYAKTIEANYALAVTYALNITLEMVHDSCKNQWQKTQNKLLKKAGHAQRTNSANGNPGRPILTGEDLREIVTSCDYLLSWSHPNFETKTNLINIVRALGYVGLAGVLEGKASTGDASIWYDNGRMYLKGSSNTSGYRAFRRISGVTTPYRRGDGKPYSVPSSEFEAFKTVVMTYWPMYEPQNSGETWESFEEKCKNFVTENAVNVSSMLDNDDNSLVTNNITTKIVVRTHDLVLSFVWDNTKNMSEFISNLKSFPTKERAFDPVTKTWKFHKQHLNAVKTFCGNTFGSNILVNDTGEATPLDPAYADNRPTWSTRVYRSKYIRNYGFKRTKFNAYR